MVVTLKLQQVNLFFLEITTFNEKIKGILVDGGCTQVKAS